MIRGGGAGGLEDCGWVRYGEMEGEKMLRLRGGKREVINLNHQAASSRKGGERWPLKISPPG